MILSAFPFLFSTNWRISTSFRKENVTLYSIYSLFYFIRDGFYFVLKAKKRFLVIVFNVQVGEHLQVKKGGSWRNHEERNHCMVY